MKMVYKFIRKVTCLFRPLPKLRFDYCGYEANKIIYQRLQDNMPLLVGRIGSAEMHCISNYTCKNNIVNKIKYIFGKIDINPWEKKYNLDELYINAGVFPKSEEIVERFAQLYIESINDIDILGSWLIEEELIFKRELASSIKVPLKDLEPFGYEQPWTLALKDKNVLVIHPFEATIKQQYKNRMKLFSNPEFLPKFNLKTIKAVQSIAGNLTLYKNWFDALDYMKEEVQKNTFDIAIVGCGAYGLPLSSFIKKMGKKVIHLGGATQLLFGIRGRRWEEREEYSTIMNDYWIKPLQEDYPLGYEKIENGCYW